MTERWRNFWLLLRWSIAADRKASIFLTAVNLATVLVGVAIGVALKALIDRTVRGEPAELVAGSLALLVLGQAVAGLLLVRASSHHQERSRAHLDTEVMRVVTGAPGIAHHENPRFQDDLEMLRDDQARFGQVLVLALMPISTVVMLLASLAVLARVHPLLVLLPVAAIPSALCEARGASVVRSAWRDRAPIMRKRRAYFDLATQPRSAAEIRLNGLRSELIDEHRLLSEREWQLRRQERRAAMKWNIAGRAMFSTGFVAATLSVVQLAALGRASAGDLILTITVAAQVNNRIGFLVSESRRWTPMLEAASRFAWLQRYDDQRQRDALLADGPAQIETAISVSAVSFSYGSQSAEVLDAVELVIPRGKVVALVGDNGAGKSTLVKLLLRLYEPTSGRIAVNDQDLSNVSAPSWRAHTSAAFQDFSRPELIARHAVGIGDLPHLDDEARVAGALAQAGAPNLFAEVPEGLNAPLGRSFPNGGELSGGQWQTLALARGMMRQGPALLVLDEPTSNLDADAEHELFQKYSVAAGREQQTTILVSHRFSTVRMASLIVVLDKGRIVESGTHNELMAAGGLYEELFTLQATAYLT